MRRQEKENWTIPAVVVLGLFAFVLVGMGMGTQEKAYSLTALGACLLCLGWRYLVLGALLVIGVPMQLGGQLTKEERNRRKAEELAKALAAQRARLMESDTVARPMPLVSDKMAA